MLQIAVFVITIEKRSYMYVSYFAKQSRAYARVPQALNPTVRQNFYGLYINPYIYSYNMRI